MTYGRGDAKNKYYPCITRPYPSKASIKHRLTSLLRWMAATLKLLPSIL